MVGNVIEVKTIDELDDLLGDAKVTKKLLILDTFATWCGPCKAIAPFFAGLSVNPNYRDWVVFAKTDVDVAEDIAKELEVRSMPTFYLFYDMKIVTQFSGASTSKITEVLNNHRHLVGS